MAKLYNDIPGWFTYASLYDEVIKKYADKPANFIEIGCWFGRSGTYMVEQLAELGANTHVFFLDTWLGGKDEPEERGLVTDNGVDYVYNAFKENISKVGYKNTHVVRDDSVKGADNFPDEFFDFIFIDAGHHDWECYNDMVAWYPKLRSNGIMAGHDIDYIDVENSVKRFASEYNINIGNVGSHTQCWRFTR
jgi:predicted O-methyltransferase YrrM